jgi:hypothetical protein
MDYVKLVELAPAYVALIIFVWFTLRLVREHRLDAETRDVRWLQAAEKRDKDWREFLEGERTQRRESMDQGLEGMGDITRALDRLAVAMRTNETNSVARYERLMEMHSSTRVALEEMEKNRIKGLEEMAEGIREFTSLAHVHPES